MSIEIEYANRIRIGNETFFGNSYTGQLDGKEIRRFVVPFSKDWFVELDWSAGTYSDNAFALMENFHLVTTFRVKVEKCQVLVWNQTVEDGTIYCKFQEGAPILYFSKPEKAIMPYCDSQRISEIMKQIVMMDGQLEFDLVNLADAEEGPENGDRWSELF